MIARLRKLVVDSAVIALVTIVCLGLAEVLSALALRRIVSSRPRFSSGFDDTLVRRVWDSERPPDYYRGVIAETFAHSDTTYSPLVEYRMVPYDGTYYRMSPDGFRPIGRAQDLDAPGPKVFVFGGSTTLGLGVADDETIPAYLDEALRAAGVAQAQVFNFGVVGWYSTQERIALERMLTAGRRPDVAIFIDGLNDFCFCAIPDRTGWNERLEQATRARAELPLLVDLAERSKVLKLLKHLKGDGQQTLRYPGALCKDDENVRQVARRLDTNRRIVSAMGARLGFRTLFVQQPVPTFHYDNAKRPYPFHPDMFDVHVNSGRGYVAMDAMREAGELFTDELLWLAELEPEGGANAYVDVVHYTPRFHRTIAKEIARAIVERKLLP